MFNKLFFKYLVYIPTTHIQHMNVQRSLNELNNTQYSPVCALREIQEEQLIYLVKHAKQYVPYYANLPQISSLDEIQTLPVLTKSQIQENAEQLISRDTSPYTVQKATGGSTGTPLQLKHTNHVHERHLAAMWRGYSWAGVDMGDRRGHFWSVPISTKKLALSKLQDFITNRRRYSAFTFQPKDLDRYTANLNKFQPHYFYGYSSMLEKFACHLQEKNTRLAFSPHAIITTAEMLTVSRRSIIETVFNAPVFNEYGCGEVGTIAHECECGSMHINAENIIVEILDDNDQPVSNGTIGNIVVTLLRNTVMPIIRYKIGDLAALEDTICACDKTLPVMTAPIGRVLDYLKRRDGTTYYGNIFIHKLVSTLNSSSKAIHQIQVVQHSYDHFTFNIVPGRQYSEDVPQFLQEEIHSLFGNDAIAQTNLTNEIPRAASGKLRNVICEV